MDKKEIRKILEKVKKGNMGVESALRHFRDMPFKDIGHTRIDTHRELRKGYPEVIYGAGKTIDQICDIVTAMIKRNSNIIITRVTKEVYKAVKKVNAGAVFHDLARIVSITKKKFDRPKTYISVITAGTSDLPVAEEAAVTAELLGNRVERIFDVGVAGIHRIMDKLELVNSSKVVIVIAGMEGALSSVIGGLVDKPIIAVPTSVGYGANFGGISALLGMLTSCASGVSVVNIDNGFGAAYTASMINKL